MQRGNNKQYVFFVDDDRRVYLDGLGTDYELEQSVYRSQTRYEGMEVSDVRRLRQLDEENARLKNLIR